MPRYYFHFQNGITVLDHDGVDVVDMDAARAEAVETIATILREDCKDTLWSGQPLRLWATDGPGRPGKKLFGLQVTPEE